jgi:hypothetical protein
MVPNVRSESSGWDFNLSAFLMFNCILNYLQK